MDGDIFGIGRKLMVNILYFYMYDNDNKKSKFFRPLKTDSPTLLILSFKIELPGR